MLQWFPKDTVPKQHKKGANINSAHWGLKNKSIDLRCISWGCRDHHQPCPCTHSSQNCSVCFNNPVSAGLTHPPEGNTPCSKTHWERKSFPSVSGTRRCCMEAQSHCSCQRMGGFATQQESKLKIMQVQAASSHTYLTSTSKASAAHTSEIKHWGGI